MRAGEEERCTSGHLRGHVSLSQASRPDHDGGCPSQMADIQQLAQRHGAQFQWALRPVPFAGRLRCTRRARNWSRGASTSPLRAQHPRTKYSVRANPCQCPDRPPNAAKAGMRTSESFWILGVCSGQILGRKFEGQRRTLWMVASKPQFVRGFGGPGPNMKCETWKPTWIKTACSSRVLRAVAHWCKGPQGLRAARSPPDFSRITKPDAA